MAVPVAYSAELATRICERIASGETMRSICAEPGLPSDEAVRKWRMKYPAFERAYLAARMASAETLEYQALDFAATATDRDSAAAARVRIDTAKWAAGVRNRRVYGEKLAVEHTGADGGAIKFETDLALLPSDKIEQINAWLREAAALAAGAKQETTPNE